MSDVIVLSMRADVRDAIEADGVTADRLGSLSEAEIAALPIVRAGRRARLGDAFDVRGERSSRVRVEGDLSRVEGLAAGMSGGELIVDGSVGGRVAAGMTGGWVDVRGHAGDDAGIGMAGGALRIVGNAGDRVGAALPGASKGMTGGEIVINGSAGGDAAARARRGLVVVTGDAGPDGGRAMIAGTLMVFGRTGPRAGRGSTRGSIVALGDIDVPPTYLYACTYQPPHLRLTLTYLRRRYGVTVEDEALNGRYRRYCGDAGEIGKGEILQLVRAR
jgi:formylmethanofuran dehydrogenase subunit C